MKFNFRTGATKVGLGKIAEKIREFNFHALLIIGGYEVSYNTALNCSDCYRYVWHF